VAGANPAFPYASSWRGADYAYFGCSACSTRFIDPVPNPEQLAAIYAPAEYHEVFYGGAGAADYEATARLLARHLPRGARVFDYGCGAGHLLAALKSEGFEAAGGEFSAAAAAQAATRTGAPVFDLSSDAWLEEPPWSCIHLGDVIEHLTDPRDSLRMLLSRIEAGGWLSAAGPLEANASPVHYAARLFGWLKSKLRPNSVAEFAPYHLIFTSATAQRAAFARLGEPLEEVFWQIEEDGWPYRRNGALRNVIALSAIAAARVLPGWGNRFRALYRKVN
jgi:SAM-dependent methyltransferase